MQTNRMLVTSMPFKSLAALCSLLLVIDVKLVFSRPAQESNRSPTGTSVPIYEDVPGYLMKFGYLPESDLETGNLQTEDHLRNALRTLQKFGNIPITGQMDEATKELMRKPRCGVSDVTFPGKYRSKRYTLHGQKWHHVNLTWSLRTRHFPRMDHGWVRSDLHKALNLWAKHSKLSFREVNSESADILVYFEKGYHGDGFPFDGPGLILAHGFFPGSGRGGDAHFDEEEEWLLNGNESNDGTSLYTVAAHEFGHSLGLAHSSVPSSLMYPWYHGLKPDSELSDDDRFGIQILYGSKDDKIWGDIPEYRPSSPRPDRPTTTSTTTVRPGKPTIPMTTTTTTTTTPKITTTTTTTTTTKYFTSRTILPRRPDVRVTPPVAAVDDKPDFCNTSFDAVSIIRKDTFFFKGKYTWRLGIKGVYPGYPALISRLWYNLPENMTRIDAVYEKQDGKIVFFIGRLFYMFNGNVMVPGYPKPLTALGLPEDLDHVDAATVWGHNSKTYIFSETMYWRYDDETDRMELDYPRDMSIWRGVGYNIDSAFQWHDGATYFLKNRHFWKFNDLRMRVEQEEPRSIGQFWFNCTVVDGDGDKKVTGKNKGRVTTLKGNGGGRNGKILSTVDDESSSAATAIVGHTPLLLFTLAASFTVVHLRSSTRAL